MLEFEKEVDTEIRASVKKLSESEIPKYQNSKFYGSVPKELFKSFGKIGVPGLVIKQEYGGLEAGALTVSVVMEEIAAVDLGCAIFISVHCMVAGLLSRFANTEQCKRLLPFLVEGQNLGAFALTEPSAGSDAANLRMTYRATDGGFHLRGEKCYITSAGFADLYIIFARAEGSSGASGISAFVLKVTDGKIPEGLSISTPDKKMGAELSPIASLRCENLFIPKENLLGQIGDGFKIALSGLAGGRVNMAACANGVSASAIKKAMAHLEERKQFGKNLIEFQGLQFMLADMQIKLSASKLLTLHSARELDANPSASENKILTSMAKCFATDSAMQITTDAVQLLGGAGYLKDYKVEQLMRDAKMLQIVEGTNQIQRHIIAREMQQIYSK